MKCWHRAIFESGFLPFSPQNHPFCLPLDWWDCGFLKALEMTLTGCKALKMVAIRWSVVSTDDPGHITSIRVGKHLQCVDLVWPNLRFPWAKQNKVWDPNFIGLPDSQIPDASPFPNGLADPCCTDLATAAGAGAGCCRFCGVCCLDVPCQNSSTFPESPYYRFWLHEFYMIVTSLLHVWSVWS